MFLLGYCISFDMKTCAQSSAADFIRVLRHIIAPLFSQYTCQKKLKHFFYIFLPLIGLPGVARSSNGHIVRLISNIYFCR